MTRHSLGFALWTRHGLNGGSVVTLLWICDKRVFLGASTVHSLTFKRGLCPQYFFGEFSADEINQFFVTPRGYVEVRQLKSLFFSTSREDEGCGCRVRQKMLRPPLPVGTTGSTQCHIWTKLQMFFLKWPFSHLDCQSNPVFSPCSFPPSTTRFHVSPSLLVCTFCPPFIARIELRYWKKKCPYF